jgi:hypothetical protein
MKISDHPQAPAPTREESRAPGPWNGQEHDGVPWARGSNAPGAGELRAWPGLGWLAGQLGVGKENKGTQSKEVPSLPQRARHLDGVTYAFL